MTVARPLARTGALVHRLDLLANPLTPSLHVYEALSNELQLRRPASRLEGALIERLALQ